MNQNNVSHVILPYLFLVVRDSNDANLVHLSGKTNTGLNTIKNTNAYTVRPTSTMNPSGGRNLDLKLLRSMVAAVLAVESQSTTSWLLITPMVEETNI